MVLQPTRRTAEEYCYPRGGLLPRLLTLTLAGGYFLLRYYTLTDIKPLTCVVLCVARTFLPHLTVAAIERVCRDKGTKKVETTNTRNKKTTPEGVVFRIELFSDYLRTGPLAVNSQRLR